MNWFCDIVFANLTSDEHVFLWYFVNSLGVQWFRVHIQTWWFLWYQRKLASCFSF